jgi:hypothetical protein
MVGGQPVLRLLVQLELRRQAFRKRFLAGAGRADRCLTLGGLVLLIGIIATPLVATVLPTFSIVAGGFLIVGGILTLTIALAPMGLFLL